MGKRLIFVVGLSFLLTIGGAQFAVAHIFRANLLASIFPHPSTAKRLRSARIIAFTLAVPDEAAASGNARRLFYDRARDETCAPAFHYDGRAHHQLTSTVLTVPLARLEGNSDGTACLDLCDRACHDAGHGSHVAIASASPPKLDDRQRLGLTPREWLLSVGVEPVPEPKPPKR